LRARTPGRRRRDASETIFEGDPQLFAALRAWRRAEAIRQKAPPYVIFSDRTLAEIATRKPADAAALSRVSGVGESKLARYGPAVLALVAGEVPPGD
jgi:ATP-dependent DNA helicase RecQ